MEPIKTKINYVIYTKVAAIEERFRDKHVSGYGKDAVFEKEQIGFFVGFEGSHELLYVGNEKPPFYTGEDVRISIEKTDAKP